MRERADLLILNYVSKAADAAHGVLRPEQRLDFTRRLRARIEEERRGSQSAGDVTKLLARFGDPVKLVEREARRLAEPGGGRTTVAFPPIRDDLPPRGRLSARQGRELPFAGLRRAAMSVANPMVTEGRDARTVVKEHPREAAALVVLVVAGLLVPLGLRPVAIFQVPVMVWAAGAALVMFGDAWKPRDRLIGVAAPLLGYGAGGLVVGGLRVGGEPGLQRFVAEFFNASGVMFMIGTGVGVAWLAYRLIDQE
ncbi:hypothetical protein OUY22_35280 [Nonomuraea sp. MCN248]|uniref:DUF1707 domain-containing protein n=1 Tax=Nonomuraea corallina TaxID=2989783 RepID=A0ABT4SN94_9ACTN|nr:hypothetical protein [Nonomuraea corallina]MDA0638702.1 hypothetical protein [Nonomuraea corallina]